MSAPEIKSFATILADLLAEGKSRMTRVKNWVVGGVMHSILAVLAKGLAALYENLARAIDLAFLETSEGVYLRAIARLIGVTPREATKATGRVVFYRTATTSPKTIPAGTLVAVASGSPRFKTTAAATLAIGETEIEVAVEAELAGSAGNVGDGSINRLISSLPGIDGVRSDQAGGWLDREGSDADTEEQLRERCQVRWATFSYGGTAQLYISTALEITGVDRVTVLSRAPRGEGTVDIVLSSTAADGVPTPALLAAVQALVDARKPCEADVLVKAPTLWPEDVTLTVVRDLEGGTAAEIRAAVEDAVEALFLPSTGEQVYDIGDDLVRAKLFAAAIAVPYVANVVVVEPANDVPIGDDRLARLGALTVEVV
jgi:uncharacterized phage protein gp47/JayE